MLFMIKYFDTIIVTNILFFIKDTTLQIKKTIFALK